VRGQRGGIFTAVMPVGFQNSAAATGLGI
jgi:hypothetical protein